MQYTYEALREIFVDSLSLGSIKLHTPLQTLKSDLSCVINVCELTRVTTQHV